MTSSSTTPSFARLGVPTFIAEALAERGITTPFAIQAATIADGLAGRDVLGRAPTGSGKTLAFGVPTIANVSELGRSAAGRPVGLILAPTRELAEQITTELRSFAGKVRVAAVYGGVGYGAQLEALRRGVDVLVACPGRLEDLIQRGDVDLGEVVHVVLDEADRMADMGFLPAVRRLLGRTATPRQTMLFSATLDGEVAKLTSEHQVDPVRHEVGSETPDVRAATHRFWTVERTERNPWVVEVVNAAWPSIIFTRTRHGADRLARQLAKLGVHAAPIHGGRSQSQRNRALDDFTNGRVHALVATDVAARGIHVDGVASVIHYDPPEDHKTYVHRSGRTARAGADGFVVSLVQDEHHRDVRKMQREIGLDEPFTTPRLDDVRGMVPAGALAGDRVLNATPAPTMSRPEPNGSTSSKPRSAGGDRPRRRRNGGPDRDRRPSHASDRQGTDRQGADRQGADRQGSDRQGAERTDSKRRSSNGQTPGRQGAGRSGGQPRKAKRGGGDGQGPAGSGQRQGGTANRAARRAHLQRPR
jgi:superfamily II DNA/RNA helicase